MTKPAAEYQRAYRARNGARVGEAPGPLPSAPCGTVSAYKRHRRYRETPCPACYAAWNAYQLAARARRNLRQTP